MEKTNKQAAEDYAGVCECGECPRCYSQYSFIAGAEFKESQLMPLIEEMREALRSIKLYFDCDYCDVNNETVCAWHLDDRMSLAKQTIDSIEQKLKEIKGE